ncbi:MAG: hypothetical protein AAF914_11445 [Pseudomonadota bacterium]
MRPWGSTFSEHVKAHLPDFDGVPPRIHAGLVRSYIAGALARPLPREDAERLAEPWLSPKDQRAISAQFAQADEVRTAEVEPLFGTVHRPAVVLWGEDDPWIPMARGQALRDALPKGMPFRSLPGLGHLPQSDAPETVVALALEVL